MEPVRDMRDFLQRLEEMGEIKTLEGVDLNLEVGALTEFMGEREGPALLFGAFELTIGRVKSDLSFYEVSIRWGMGPFP